MRVPRLVPEGIPGSWAGSSPLSRTSIYRQEATRSGLAFAGFLLFLDPPKARNAGHPQGVSQSRGIKVKVITGDNRYVARTWRRPVGLAHVNILTGEDLGKLTKEALLGRAPKIDLFVEIDPNQKERIIAALRTARACRRLPRRRHQ